jgi:hypothetical protein
MPVTARRTGARSRSAFSSRALDTSSLATNIQKLFSERIDFFTPVRLVNIYYLQHHFYATGLLEIFKDFISRPAITVMVIHTGTVE